MFPSKEDVCRQEGRGFKLSEMVAEGYAVSSREAVG